jgi:hypothetical protein
MPHLKELIYYENLSYFILFSFVKRGGVEGSNSLGRVQTVTLA